MAIGLPLTPGGDQHPEGKRADHLDPARIEDQWLADSIPQGRKQCGCGRAVQSVRQDEIPDHLHVP